VVLPRAEECGHGSTAAPEMAGEIYGCVTRLAATLNLEYAEALEAVEIGGAAVKAFAAKKGLTASNAGVRIFRAREALKKRVVESCGTCAEHGCIDCTCKPRSTDRPGGILRTSNYWRMACGERTGWKFKPARDC